MKWEEVKGDWNTRYYIGLSCVDRLLGCTCTETLKKVLAGGSKRFVREKVRRKIIQ